MELILANKIDGEKAKHFFRNDDGVVGIECTIEEYHALSLPNPINPTMDGYIWEGSASFPKYDTPSGFMENGYYRDDGNEYDVMVNGVDFQTAKENIIDGVISDDLIPT